MDSCNVESGCIVLKKYVAVESRLILQFFNQKRSDPIAISFRISHLSTITVILTVILTSLLVAAHKTTLSECKVCDAIPVNFQMFIIGNYFYLRDRCENCIHLRTICYWYFYTNFSWRYKIRSVNIVIRLTWIITIS